MGLKLTNNAISLLAGSINSTDTEINLIPGDGAMFPELASGDWFPATIVSGTGELEIVRVTARSVDTLTIVRAQENTIARSFNASDRVELRLTAAVIAAITADIGEINDGIETINSDIDAINAGIALLLPPGTGPIPWSLPSEPTGWIFCDGRTLTSGTPYTALRSAYIAAGFPFGQDGSGNPKIPDMRGRVAAGLDNMSSGAAGRLTGATIGAGLGAQTHTLTWAEMPTHAHGVNDPTHAHGAWQDGHTHEVSGVATGRAAGGYYISTVSGGYENRIPVFPNSSSSNSPTSSGASANGVYVGGAYTGISIQNAGSGGAHNNVQPTLVTNYILKV